MTVLGRRGAPAVLLLALVGCGAPATPMPPPPPLAPAPGSPNASAAAPAETPTPIGEDLPPAVPSGETVTLKLVADARRQAHVFWGRKDLGLAPLEVTRPRGSGPLDLLVVAPGALPLHTRVFTDRSETLALRLYSEKDATGLLGWKAPDPAEPRPSKPRLEAGPGVRPKGKPRPPP